jgi:N-carbamoylputrescine amidase
MQQVAFGAIQMAIPGWSRPDNLARAEARVRAAAQDGAQVILLSELFELPYFCTEQDPRHFALAEPLEGNATVARFAQLARALGVVLPISFFERAGAVYYNTVAMIDADGAVLGIYRKTHIPDGPGYSEKYYFTPGDTGFRVWDTRFGRLGVGICWDQWFPEAARAMALLGAQALLYPTAIGSEPHNPQLDSAAHWQRVMQGHAAANMLPVVAANRVGTEAGRDGEQTYYGASFIADATGALVAEAGRTEETTLVAAFDLEAQAQARAAWGLFRDRRPEAYAALAGSDGRQMSAFFPRPWSRGINAST